MTGTVYLVGAGPGDPELLTLKGRRCLERADVVVHDALVDKRLLEFMRPGALAVDVGKRRGYHPWPQEEIHALLIEHARAGRTVVRLKGGDPLLFGRGAEEAQALRAAGIPFEIVPGVSAGLAVPAYAGIPLTHRDVGPDVTFVTGHECRAPSRIRWDLLAGASTLVFFMALATLDRVVGRLLETGRDPSTPAAAISSGTTERQRTVVAPLATLPAAVRAAGLEPPALVVVGDVVRLREALAWFPEGN